jgi:cytochrome c1
MFALLAALPFVGGLIGRANRFLVELLAWGGLAVAIAIAGAAAYERVYDRGVAAERGHTIAAQAERDIWRNRAVRAEATAADNERSALALGRSLQEQADAYDRADAQAHADADRYTAALDAARAARCIAGPDPVHQALTGRTSPPEDAPLPMSLREAVKSLRKGGHR